MSLASAIRQFIEEMMKSASITSASPNFINRVVAFEWFGETSNFEEVIRSEVKNIVTSEQQKGVAQGGAIQKGTLKKVLETDLGVSKAREGMSILQNPQGAVLSQLAKLARAGGPLGAIIIAALAVPEVTKQIINMLTRQGGHFDLTFRDRIDDLTNALRAKDQQKQIRSGFTQVIFTTRAGTTDPRDSYNTYQQKDEAEANLERDWAIRNVLGVN